MIIFLRVLKFKYSPNVSLSINIPVRHSTGYSHKKNTAYYYFHLSSQKTNK
jgi:hypothetical protein